MTQGPRKSTFLFLHPHPDDLEFCCANLMKALADAGHHIFVACLTKGEFGLPKSGDRFKGTRLGRIRARELIKACQAHGVERVLFLGSVDGFVKVDYQHLAKVLHVIERIRPDVLLAPEAYFTYYWHPDHVATGRLAYIAISKLRREGIKKVPLLLYFQTIRNEIHVPFPKKTHGIRTIEIHKSQEWLMRPLTWIYGLLYRVIGRKTPRAPYAEGFRRLRFEESDFQFKNPLERGIVSACYSMFAKWVTGDFYLVEGKRPPFLDALLEGPAYLSREPEVDGMGRKEKEKET